MIYTDRENGQLSEDVKYTFGIQFIQLKAYCCFCIKSDRN